jgi:hypothetical protein
MKAEPEHPAPSEIDTLVVAPPVADDAVVHDTVVPVEHLRAVEPVTPLPIAAKAEAEEAIADDIPLTRESRDRVVAVDEFRPREIAGPATGRGRPRTPRIAVPSATVADSVPRDATLFGAIAPSDELLPIARALSCFRGIGADPGVADRIAAG